MLLLSTVALAQSAPTLHLSLPEPLRLGAQGSLRIEASVPPDMPLLLTIQEEGEAIESLKGRLLRHDAEDPRATPLRFNLPLRGREAGFGSLTVRLQSHRCDDRGCEEIDIEETISLEVRLPEAGKH